MFLLVTVLAVTPAQPQFNWTVSSANGTAVLTQTALPDNACTLKCAVKGKEAWTQGACLGRATDFVFPAEDCSSALMLTEYPLRASPTEATAAAMSLSARGGVVSTKVYRLQELVDVTRLRGEGKRVRWLAGAVGEPGVKPHFNEAGTGIEFSTTEGTRRVVQFGEELALERPRAPQNGSAQGATNGLYQYTGADGSTQFVMGLDQVPKKYRKSATPVESEVATMESAKTAPSRRDPGFTVPGREPTFNAPLPPPSFVVPSAPTQGAAGNNECHIYGLQGPACQAVQLQQAQRYRTYGGSPPSLPTPKPGPSPYTPPPSPYK